MHAYEMHANEVYPHDMHAREMHAHEVHANEVHAHKVHAREVHAREMICFGAAPPPGLSPVLALQEGGLSGSAPSWNSRFSQAVACNLSTDHWLAKAALTRVWLERVGHPPC